ncbi:hypothetical protein ACFW84_00305 [Streptomyces anulatus]|uniref:hypothetical protein n=1 Tax=Streptomyces anulatus TaxID=1892 RepID=UPI003684B282
MSDGEVIVSSVCTPPATTPEYVAAYAPSVVIGTVTTRYIPDTGGPSTGVQVAALTGWRTLKGSAQGDIDLHQAVSRTAQGTYTTAEPLYQPLATGQRYTAAVLDRTEDGDRWVWGAERAPESRIDRLGIKLRVVGRAERSSHGHAPVAYLPLKTWQRIRFSTPGAPASATAAIPDQFSALALRTPPDGASATALDARYSTTTLTKEKAYDAAPGYTGERVTMNSIQAFLYLIAPLVVGAFFAV